MGEGMGELVELTEIAKLIVREGKSVDDGSKVLKYERLRDFRSKQEILPSALQCQ